MKLRRSIIAAAMFSLLAPSATVLVKSADAGVSSQEDKKKPTRNRQEDRRNDRRQNGEDDENENLDMRFAGMDRNRDGRITRDEWRGNDNSFAQHDWNGDGVLSGAEVRPGAQPTNRRETEARARFDRLDLNDDNAISLSEWIGTRNAFERLDRNDDGFLSFDEFNARR
ncbi:MAG TPA: hypothetical protein VF789_09090 [Thermoanaerobaculia bacterium]